MLLSAICTGVELSYLKNNDSYYPYDGTATFMVFGKYGNETIQLPFRPDDIPSVSEEYTIEVTPCK